MIINKIKKIAGTDLVKVSSLNAVSTLIRMLTAFVSVKIVAVLIGPAGIALLGQLNNFSTIFLSISAGGINTGVTKHIAQYSDAERKFRLFLGTGFRITAVLSVTCGLVLIFGAGYFSELIFKEKSYTSIFYIFGVTIVLYALNAFFLAVLNGFREFKKYVSINIIGNVIGLIFSIVLSYSFGVYGALLSLVTYQSITFIVTMVIAVKLPWFKWSYFSSRFSKTAAIRLSHFSLMALVSAISVPTSQLVVRNFIAKHESIVNAGLWEGMNRISNIYLLVITTSFSVYYLPRLSGLKSDGAIRKEVKTVYKFLVPFLLITALSIYFFRNLIIHILFNEKFAGMENLFGFQLLGDFLKMCTWGLGYIQMAKGMVKTYIVVEIVSCTLFALLSTFFIGTYGTIGAPIGYAAAFFLQLLMMLFVFRKLLFGHEK